MNSSPFEFLLPAKAGKVILALSIIVLVFWGSMALIGNVYKYPIVGVIAEILWIPMILFLILLPVISIIRALQKRAEARSLSFIAVVIGVANFLIVVLR